MTPKQADRAFRLLLILVSLLAGHGLAELIKRFL